MAWVRGTKMLDHEARSLEEGLASNPDNVSARVMLSAFGRAHDRYEHLFWLIENAPALDLGGGWLIHQADDAFRGGSDRWEAAIRRHPGDYEVVKNAAAYHLYAEPSVGERIYLEAIFRDPTQAQRHLGLARFYEDWAATDEVGERTGKPRELALARYLKAYELMGSSGTRFSLTWSLRQCAARAGEAEKHRRLRLADEEANELERHATDEADASHHACMVDGLVALAADDADGAAQHLRAAADAPLPSHWPSMTLARELLATRPSDVAAYLERCAERVPAEGDELLKQANAVRRGETPELGVK